MAGGRAARDRQPRRRRRRPRPACWRSAPGCGSGIRWCARRPTGRRRCRSARRCTRPGGGHRPGRRSRPPRLAPGPRRARARRGRRRRAGALGRPRPGARWPGRGGRVPAARGRADAPTRRAGPGARWPPRRPSSQAGAFDAALGLLAAAEAGPLDELGAPAWSCCGPRSRSSQSRGSDAPLLLLRAARRLEPLDARLARDTYLDALGRSAVRRAAGERRRQPARRLAAPWRPRPRGGSAACRAICCWTASRCVFTEGRAAAAPVLRRAVRRVRGHRGLRGGGAPLGLAGVAGGAPGLGPRALPRDRHARGSARPRLRARSSVLAVALTTPAARPHASAATSRGRAADRGGRMPSRRRPGPASAAVRCDCARRDPRPGGRGLRADRRRHRGSHRRRPGDRGPVRALGERRAHTTASAAMRRRSRRPRGERASTPELVRRFVGADRADRGGRPGPENAELAEGALDATRRAHRGRRHRLGARHRAPDHAHC